MVSFQRKLRKQNDHSTMLIHTTPRVVVHDIFQEKIIEWLKNFIQNIYEGNAEKIDLVKSIWEKEIETNFNDKIVKGKYNSTNEIIDLILKSELFEDDKLEDLVIVENGISEKRIEYTEEPRTVILVGGTVLSRGLTLEGLSVSYFARKVVRMILFFKWDVGLI